MKSVTCFAPASIANVGPFYDVMGYCLSNFGDFVEANEAPDHNLFKLTSVVGPFADKLNSVTLEDNVVQYIAEQIWEDLERPHPGINLTLHKYMPIGTGLGSSGASAVATAKAILTFLDAEKRFSQEEILGYLVQGEQYTSEQFYPDNVAPSFYGGFNIISGNGLRRIPVKDFYSVVLLQNSLETKGQRRLIDQHFLEHLTDDSDVKEKISRVLTVARFQAREASILIDALREGDLETAGKVVSQIPTNSGNPNPNVFTHISHDPGNFVEIARSETIPHYCSIKSILIEEGAYGVGIAGSGPAIFAFAPNAEAAVKLKNRALERLNKIGIPDIYWLISDVNLTGAREIKEPIPDFVRSAKQWHNFWG